MCVGGRLGTTPTPRSVGPHSHSCPDQSMATTTRQSTVVPSSGPVLDGWVPAVARRGVNKQGGVNKHPLWHPRGGSGCRKRIVAPFRSVNPHYANRSSGLLFGVQGALRVRGEEGVGRVGGEGGGGARRGGKPSALSVTIYLDRDTRTSLVTLL